MTEVVSGSDPFDGVEERHAADYALRNTQQHLVQLSAQADLKASIVMTVSALLMSIAAARAGSDDLLWGVIPFAVVLAGALLWAVLAIVPGKGGARARPDLLFFTDVAGLSRDEYAVRMAALFAEDNRLYRVMVDNIHDHSAFLVHHKYRYLRYAYLWFVSAFAAGAAGIAVGQLVG